jgi:hypothetical protein
MSHTLNEVLNYTYLGIITASDLYNETDLAISVTTKTFKENQIGAVFTSDVGYAVKNLNKKYPDNIIDRVNIYDYTDENFANLTTLVNSTITIDNPSLFITTLEGYFQNMQSSKDFKDDLKNLIIQINNNNNYLILITNSKTSVEDIENFIFNDGDIQNKPFFFSFDEYFISCEDKNDTNKKAIALPNIEFHPYKLTSLQCAKFKLLADFPPNKDKPDWREYNFEETKYYNIVYPENVQRLIEKNDENITIENIVKIYGNDIIYSNTPKIKSMMNEVILKNIDKSHRHVIFTNVDSYFGTSLISNILTLRDKPIEHIIIDNNVDSMEDKIAKIDIFNTEVDEDSGNLKYKVLITNSNILNYYNNKDDLKYIDQVNHYHILDQDFTTAYEILHKLYKINNFNTALSHCGFNLHLYYGVVPGNETFEKKNVQSFYNFLRSNYIFYENRWRNGNFLILNSTDNETLLVRDKNV